ncbi:mannosyltransferase putative-domain-containing protein [Exophiala viscosa]|uniref:Mannosyltransferase putative-domain-containing protein n=1 Tax=Exophiala viscosa TaxID=2486360 RepID=A0AAN6DZY1_9EURO|nr:mannosyltransferase putative-domain-containing protein [Exophiala viscosa]
MPTILNSKLNYYASNPNARRLLAGVGIIFILYLIFGTETSRSLLDVGSSSTRIAPKIQHNFADGLDTPLDLNVSQWGERAIKVRQMSQWADLAVKNPAAERKAFEKALQTQFPFLAGTESLIYAPWSANAKQFSSQVGMVICTGSNNFHLAAHLIASLRRVHKSKLPIEIAYSGDNDLKPEHRTFLQNLESGITFIDLLDRFPHAHDELVNGGWAMKPFALLASSHTKSMLVDADAIFLTSPDSIFDINPGLHRTGTLFFHDRAALGGGDERRDWVKDQIAAAGIEPSQYLSTESLFYSGKTWYEADSGVTAMDKSRPDVLMGLIFATWMNTKKVRDEVSYKVFYGDKETFWVAMELSAVDYFFQPWYAGTMGTITKEDGQPEKIDLKSTKVEICGTHMLHLDHLGQTPFWINGGIYEHKEDPSTGYSTMTHYWVGETSDIRLTQPQWYWVNGNTGCLRETGVRVIPDQIRRNIEKIENEATRIDELIRHM